MNTETNYSLKEAKSIMDWFVETYGLPLATKLIPDNWMYLHPGTALDDLINKLYTEADKIESEI